MLLLQGNGIESPEDPDYQGELKNPTTGVRELQPWDKSTHHLVLYSL